MFSQIRLKAIRISRGEAWRNRDVHSCVPTPTHTQHDCISPISSGNQAKNTWHPRNISWVYLQSLSIHQGRAWSGSELRFFPTSSANPHVWAVDRAETSRALPLACFFFCDVSNQFSLLWSCYRVEKVPSWWEIRGSLACTQSLFSPKHWGTAELSSFSHQLHQWNGFYERVISVVVLASWR